MAREDLGEAGMDTGAIERLGERMRRSGAQEESVTRNTDELHAERLRAELQREIDRDRELDHGFGIE